MLGGPAPALAGDVPETFTFGARSTSATTISVSGSVNARGQATTVRVRFDSEASEFCQNSGQGGAPVTGSATVDGGSADGEVELTVTQGGMDPGSDLCVQLIATNESGTSQSSAIAHVVVGAPEVAVQYHQGTGPTSVRAIGEIWTAGQPTTVHVEYAENEPVTSDFCTSGGVWDTRRDRRPTR